MGERAGRWVSAAVANSPCGMLPGPDPGCTRCPPDPTPEAPTCELNDIESPARTSSGRRKHRAAAVGAKEWSNSQTRAVRSSLSFSARGRRSARSSGLRKRMARNLAQKRTKVP